MIYSLPIYRIYRNSFEGIYFLPNAYIGSLRKGGCKEIDTLFTDVEDHTDASTF
jgi:hypothetical protein